MKRIVQGTEAGFN